MTKLSSARYVAFNAFTQVIEHGQDPDMAIDKFFKNLKTDERNSKKNDRGLAKEIVYGSLRWYSKIYWILQNTSSRNLDKVTPAVRAALVCGTYQIYYMDRIPDRAAVNESVEYLRSCQQPNACSFVNGILRQIARRAEYFAKPDKETQVKAYLTLQYAHPEWLVERWLRIFKPDRVEAMLAAHNQPPVHFARVNSLKTPLSQIRDLQHNLLKEEKVHSERRPLRSSLILKDFPPIAEDSLFQKGFYTIQDEGAQLISLLLGIGEEGSPFKTAPFVIDACAAPGGKLSHVYELLQAAHPDDFDLLALDVDETRLGRAKDTMKRLGFDQVRFECQDFLNFKTRKKPHKILLDSPCSGLGVLRRHPEGKWQKKQSIIPIMVERQRALIDKALTLLPKGGELVFCVCSFEKEESINQLNWIKNSYGDKIEVVTPVHRIPDYYKKYVTRDNVLTIYSSNTDQLGGFSAFIIRKT